MEVKNLEQVLVPADHTVNSEGLIGRRLETVGLADLITAATHTRPADNGQVRRTITIREEPVDDGNNEFV